MNRKALVPRSLKSVVGFTLIELLIVVVLLGIFAALIIGNFLTSLKKGRDAKRKGDLEQVTRALEMYYEDKKTYPSSLSFGSSLCETAGCLPGEKIYMQKLPNDPSSGKNYEYNLLDGSYRLYTCLENSQQVLPYDSLTQNPSMTCSLQCKKNNGDDTTTGCIWAISSSDISP